MADLFVTFGKARARKALSAADANFPVMQGAGVRTEALLITSSSQVTSLAAVAGEQFIRLLADAACFVQVGPSPTAVAAGSTLTDQGVDVIPLASGAVIELEVRVGDKVAVIEKV